MTRTHRRADAAGVDLPISCLRDEARCAEDPARGSAAAEFGVTFDGRQFCLAGYRYDRVEDAVAYARLLAKRGEWRLPGGSGHPCAVVAPTAEQQDEMVTLGVTARGGRYHFREYVYDNVADALAYARRASPGR